MSSGIAASIRNPDKAARVLSALRKDGVFEHCTVMLLTKNGELPSTTGALLNKLQDDKDVCVFRVGIVDEQPPAKEAPQSQAKPKKKRKPIKRGRKIVKVTANDLVDKYGNHVTIGCSVEFFDTKQKRTRIGKVEDIVIKRTDPAKSVLRIRSDESAQNLKRACIRDVHVLEV